MSVFANSIEALEKERRYIYEGSMETDGMDYSSRNHVLKDLDGGIALLKVMQTFAEEIVEGAVDKMREDMAGDNL